MLFAAIITGVARPATAASRWFPSPPAGVWPSRPRATESAPCWRGGRSAAAESHAAARCAAVVPHAAAASHTALAQEHAHATEVAARLLTQPCSGNRAGRCGCGEHQRGPALSSWQCGGAPASHSRRLEVRRVGRRVKTSRRSAERSTPAHAAGARTPHCRLALRRPAGAAVVDGGRRLQQLGLVVAAAGGCGAERGRAGLVALIDARVRLSNAAVHWRAPECAASMSGVQRYGRRTSTSMSTTRRCSQQTVAR